MNSTLERLIEPTTSYALARPESRPEFAGTMPGVVRAVFVTAADLVTTRTGYGIATDGAARDFAQSLRRIQENTGMSWGEIASALGVSRRTVHNWLAAGRVNGENARRISGLYRAFTQELIGVPRESARDHLLAPGNDGTRWAVVTRAIRAAYPRQPRVASGFDVLRDPSPTPDLSHIDGGIDETLDVIEGDDF